MAEGLSVEQRSEPFGPPEPAFGLGTRKRRSKLSSAEPSGESRESGLNVIGPTIEVASIDGRHNVPGLLKEFGTKIILRLGVDPVRVSSGVLKRSVVVDRISPASRETRRVEIREIGWGELPDHVDDCEQLRTFRLNEQDITEKAAIGIMVLLIHELEGAVLRKVLQIGEGGDYLVKLAGYSDHIQVEVSGIRIGTVGVASARVVQKRGQVRGAGFVSVTTFQHGQGGAAHSYLHFVDPADEGKGTSRERPRRKKQ
jgi:hypothetical protein